MKDGGDEGAVYIGRFLTISPGDELFIPNNHNADSKGIIILINTGNKSLAFKVKTNAPDKYRVRPCTGIIKPGEEIDITVTVHPEFQNQPQTMQDKFLVMAMEVNRDHFSATDLQDLWKNCPKERIMEHKIRCNLGARSSLDPQKDMELLHKKLDSLTVKCSELRRTQLVSCTLLTLLLLLLIALCVIVSYSGGRLLTDQSLLGKCSTHT